MFVSLCSVVLRFDYVLFVGWLVACLLACLLGCLVWIDLDWLLAGLIWLVSLAGFVLFCFVVWLHGCFSLTGFMFICFALRCVALFCLFDRVVCLCVCLLVGCLVWFCLVRFELVVGWFVLVCLFVGLRLDPVLVFASSGWGLPPVDQRVRP